jgi:hypothetical protein
MVMWRRLLSSVSLLAGLAGAVACNSVLGFDEAKLDPGTTTTQDQTQPLTCDTYCRTIMANCTGLQQEYLNADICKAMCQHFELGLPDDTTEDSLSCRIYHANSAKESPTVHCSHAGPTGATHCGRDPCAAFCLLEVALCNGPLLQYPGGEAECRRECAQYTYPIDDPTKADLVPDGNTLNCRLWHLESAYDPTNPQAKTTHCPHTGKVSLTCQ